MMPEQEKWRTVPGLEGYEVSSLGRVKRTARSKGAVVGAILQPYMTKGGLYVNIRGIPNFLRPRARTVGGKGISVARLIALAFLGDPDHPDAIACFRDGNPSNIRAANLVWRLRAGTPAVERMRRSRMRKRLKENQ